MKINPTQLQVYRLDQLKPVANQHPVKAAETNHFKQANFSELLSSQEKNFITQNFRPESAAQLEKLSLGRFIDVKA